MFTNEFYFDVEIEIDNYVKQTLEDDTFCINEILELPVVQEILENSFGQVSREPRQVYHHIQNALKNRRYLYPVVTTYMIRKLPVEYFFKKIYGSEEFSLFDRLLKHLFELPYNTNFEQCSLYVPDVVIEEILEKVKDQDVKIRESCFFHKHVLDCPLNHRLENWILLHRLIKEYKIVFNEEWKKQYRLIYYKIIPDFFKKAAFITNFINVEQHVEEEIHEVEVEDFVIEENDDTPELFRFNKHQLKRVRIIGDGNCLFNAISQYLYGRQDHHVQVRDGALHYIRKNMNEFSFDPSFTIDEHVNSGSWGDGSIMAAICKHYRINIKVFLTSTRNFIDGAYCPEFAENTVLLYYTGDHFDLLQKVDQPSNVVGCLYDTFSWSSLHKYLTRYENFVIPPENYCDYSMNFNFFHLLLERVDLVTQHAKDENRYHECAVILRRIENKMKGRYSCV